MLDDARRRGRACRRSSAPELNAARSRWRNGLTRLADALPRRAGTASTSCAREIGEASTRRRGAPTPASSPFAPDDIDWDDEVRIAIEERASLSPDALTGMEANLRFAGPETHGDQDLRPPVGLAELDLPAPERRRRARRAHAYGKPERPEFDWRRT